MFGAHMNSIAELKELLRIYGKGGNMIGHCRSGSSAIKRHFAMTMILWHQAPDPLVLVTLLENLFRRNVETDGMGMTSNL